MVLPESWQPSEKGDEGEQRHRDGEYSDCASESHGECASRREHGGILSGGNLVFGQLSWHCSDRCVVNLRFVWRVTRESAAKAPRVSACQGAARRLLLRTRPDPQQSRTATAMAAPTVFENVAEDANVQGGLFAGKKFWVAQRVPMRKTFLEDIKNNGGEVVMLEKHADYMIADHFRRDCPPGSISYRFIGESLKKGEIQDPENHLAGPPVGTARAAGSAARPTKGGRAAYTVEEDIILYKWVRDCEAQGGLASGNEIYKQLEAKVGKAPAFS